MSRHLSGAILPWQWGDVPLAWQDWVLISLDIHNTLQAAPDASGG